MKININGETFIRDLVEDNDIDEWRAHISENDPISNDPISNDQNISLPKKKNISGRNLSSSEYQKKSLLAQA